MRELQDRKTRKLLGPAAIWLAAFTGLPLAIVAAISLAGRGSPIAWELSGDAWRRLADPLLVPVAVRSLGFAAAATLLCLAMGVPLAYAIVRQPPRRRSFLYMLALLPMWVNTLVLAYAWMVTLRTDGVVDQAARLAGLLGAGESLRLLYTPGAVVLGLAYAYLPFMVVSVYASLEKIDWALVDAAQDLGATRLRAFTRVVLPLARPGIAAGCLLVFMPALGNFVVPQLLGGARAATIGTAVQERFLSQPQDWPLGAAMALVLTGLSAVAIGVHYRRGLS